MTPEEFLNIIRDLKLFTDRDKISLEHSLEAIWTIGGMSGGNCWGDDPSYPVEGEMEPDLENLDLVIEKLCPEITFLAYKRIISKIVKYDQDTDAEYYGNYRDMATKRVILSDLYEALKKEGLI